MQFPNKPTASVLPKPLIYKAFPAISDGPQREKGFVLAVTRLLGSPVSVLSQLDIHVRGIEDQLRPIRRHYMGSSEYFMLCYDYGRCTNPLERKLLMCEKMIQSDLTLTAQLKGYTMPKITRPAVTKKTTKASQAEEFDFEDGEGEDEVEAETPKKSSKKAPPAPVKKAKAKKVEVEDDDEEEGDEDSDDEEEEPAPKKSKKAAAPAKKAKKVVEEDDDEDSDDEDSDDEDDEEEEEAPKKAKRAGPVMTPQTTTIPKSYAAAKKAKLKMCDELKEAFEEEGDVPELLKIATLPVNRQKGPVKLRAWRAEQAAAKAKAAKKAKKSK